MLCFGVSETSGRLVRASWGCLCLFYVNSMPPWGFARPVCYPPLVPAEWPDCAHGGCGPGPSRQPSGPPRRRRARRPPEQGEQRVDRRQNTTRPVWYGWGSGGRALRKVRVCMFGWGKGSKGLGVGQGGRGAVLCFGVSETPGLLVRALWGCLCLFNVNSMPSWGCARPHALPCAFLSTGSRRGTWRWRSATTRLWPCSTRRRPR